MSLYFPIAEMSLNVLLLLFMGGGVGFLSGMFGIGGGFLMTPLLIFTGVPPAVAVATEANQITASSVSGALAHFRRSGIDIKMGLVLMAGGLGGSYVGAEIFSYLNSIGQVDLMISLAYVFFLGTIGSLMLWENVSPWLARKSGRRVRRRRKRHPAWIHAWPHKMKFKKSHLVVSIYLPILIGFVVGVLAAIMGVGGGFVMLPALIYILGMPGNVVVGTSLFPIVLVPALVTFFHLVTHAMFTGLLFLCSGSVIHALHHALEHTGDHETDPQDMRNMGGLRKRMPITYATMLIGALAISGVPLFSGFLSKDAILAGTLAFAQHHHQWWAILFPVSGFGAAALTSFYMFRLIFMTFHGKPAKAQVNRQVHEPSLVMTGPLITLAALSFALFFTLPGINPLHAEGWFTRIIPQAENLTGYPELGVEHLEHGFHEAHSQAVRLSVGVAGSGILLAIAFYLLGWLDPKAWAQKLQRIGLYQLSRSKFYFDEIYDALLYRPFLWLTAKIAWLDWDLWDQRFIDGWGRGTVKASEVSGWVDYHWLDQYVVDGLGRVVSWMGAVGRKVQTGRVQNYVLWALVGGILIVIVAANF